MFSPRNSSMSSRASPFVQPRDSRSLNRATPKSKKQNSSHFRNTSRTFNQSFQASQILEETSQHRIAAFGSALPVLITEALSLSDRRTTEITACIDPSGWAWLVGGRKLFVWRYKADGSSRAVQCKELTLPPSDLAHSAERVCLIPSPHGGQPAACVAVSPEGVVRYWPNIAFESSTGEISAELKGEECARVINFQPHGCLLATTTSSLLLLEPLPGQASISCRPLKSPAGLFSGVQRRMSSFIFGASQANGAPLQAILAGQEEEFEEEEDQGRAFYTLSGPNLCKWFLPDVGPEKMLYQIDAERVFRDSFARKVWDKDSIQMPQLKTWLLDIQRCREGVMLLGAGLNQEVAPVVYFAVALLQTNGLERPASIDELTVLDYTLKYSKKEEGQVLSHKLLLPSDAHKHMFVHTASSILMLQDDSSVDQMDLKTSGDVLLGAGSCDGVAVFFSNVHGMFSVSGAPAQPSLLDDSSLQNLTRAELSSMVMSVSKVTERTDSDDHKTRLMGAFLSSLTGDTALTEKVISELLEAWAPQIGSAGSDLDRVVATASKDLINDVPSEDPRWAEAGRTDSNSSSASVIIVQQLRDKQKAHHLFVDFLNKFGIWEKLKAVAVRDTVLPTRLLLCEHVEKLEAAIALRELHSEYQKLVDTCIRKAVAMRQDSVPASLTAQDVFYKEVSGVQDIMAVLVDYEKESLATDQPTHEMLATVQAVNAILVAMLHHALLYRQTNCEQYAGSSQDSLDYIPWTATASVRNLLASQISLSFDRGLPEARETDVQGVLFQSIVGLSDIIMDGYASQLQWMRNSEGEGSADHAQECTQLEQRFERERQKLISRLVEHQQYDRAASLAEKYEDFEMLMRICDATDNQDRLQRYRNQFADKGFAQFLFNWYMKEGKRGHLLCQPVCQGDELSQFLDADNVRYLSWLHEIQKGNFLAAQGALSDLASTEKNFLAKKKTLLSLSKLAGLAAEDADENTQDDIEVLNEELDLVLHQELLPSHTLEDLGMDPNNMRVLSPEELIELYVSEKNADANELDVKKALDLLRYIDKASEVTDYEALKLHIWCQAILMDGWTESSHADPLEINKEKVFFKAVDLVYMDGNLKELLPSLESLLAASRLSQLAQQANFKFLMRAGYEQINQAVAAMD